MNAQGAKGLKIETRKRRKPAARDVRVMDLAHGGMGHVDLVLRREGRFQRLFARKRLFAHLARDPAFRAMFMDEARVAGLIRHPNVVAVVDVGEDDDGPFLLMELVDGLPTTHLVATFAASAERLPIALCLDVVAQAARGLHAAHELRSETGAPLALVHRDVTPHNILLGYDGVVRVTDFGVAKAFGNVSRTSTGVLKGNVGYMPPECLRFETPDRRSDLFSLGVVLYELAASRRLYDGEDASAVARKVLHDPTPDLIEDRPDAPPGLIELLFSLLAKDPAQRPASAADVATRAEELLADQALVEGPFDLARFLNTRFANRRRAEADARQTAVTHALERARGRERQTWRGIGLAALALGAVALWATRTRPEHGLRAQYFDDINLQQLRVTRIDPQIHFDWTDDPPAPSIAPGTFSARFAGALHVKGAPIRQICLRMDDGARLWLDGQLVIDKWRLQQSTLHCARVELTAGRHPLRIDYFQDLELAQLKLLWSESADPDRLVPVPTDALSPD